MFDFDAVLRARASCPKFRLRYAYTVIHVAQAQGKKQIRFVLLQCLFGAGRLPNASTAFAASRFAFFFESISFTHLQMTKKKESPFSVKYSVKHSLFQLFFTMISSIRISVDSSQLVCLFFAGRKIKHKYLCSMWNANVPSYVCVRFTLKCEREEYANDLTIKFTCCHL